MNEIKELLMKSVKNSTSSYNKQQDQIPEPNKCKFCGKKIYWYYFKSHNEYMFESKWIEHLCICRIISWLSYKLNSSEQQIEKIKRSMEEENSKRDSNTDKLSRMQNARNARSRARSPCQNNRHAAACSCPEHLLFNLSSLRTSWLNCIVRKHRARTVLTEDD